MTLIADRYELLQELGHGGMARVATARDRVLDRRVAIKLLREDIGRDPVLRERFLREARLSAALAHPHIVRVYDAGVDGETPWIAMELVEGPSLREEMTRIGPLPADVAVEVITQVLAGLAVAHRSGIVHRDVKPGNVLLVGGLDGRSSGAGTGAAAHPSGTTAPVEAKLGDFGIAKSLQAGGADLTQVNQFMGTPKYIAPEVAIGMPASVRSDLYSAAVVLWEALAGEPPFDHANALTLAMMHRTDALPPLGQRRPDLPPELVAVLEMCLAKEPEQRPIDAGTMAGLIASGLRGDVAAAQAAAASAAAAVAATQVLQARRSPPGAGSSAGAAGAVGAGPAAPPIHERTLAMPLPGPIGPGAGPVTAGAPRPARPRPPQRGARRPTTAPRRGGWGVGLLVAALIGLAVVAFTLASGQGTVDPTTSPTPSTTPTAATPPATTTDVPVVAPPAPTATQAPVAPAPEPPPPSVPEPTAQPAPEPTPDPVPQPAPPPTDQPAPTSEPPPLIELFPTP